MQVDPTTVDAGARPARDVRQSPSLRELPVAGLTRRRVAWGVAFVVAAWFVVTFAGQVTQSAGAAQRAAQLTRENADLAAEVAALDDELGLVRSPVYVEQQARAYGLGTAEERAFALAPDAPPLPDDAPGSAARRIGARAATTSPLDSWLAILFGPEPGAAP